MMKKSNGMSNSKSQSNYIKSYLVSMNDGVRVCAEACACCWDKPIHDTYEGLCEYLGKRTNIGHTSVLEHSSFITVTKVPFYSIAENPEGEELMGLIDVLSSCRYLNVRVKTDNENYWVLIGGSYRGYNEMIRRLSIGGSVNDNPFTRSLIGTIYHFIPAECMYDLINEGYLERDLFRSVEPDPVSVTFNPITRKYSSDKVEVISTDNIVQIRNNLAFIIGRDIFTHDDILTVSGLTVLFKDMSRTATHQLVRHRNGITQESQRYVDYTGAEFADPTEFKPDKYDPNKIYDIGFQGQVFHLTSMQLGNAITGFYQDMLEQGMMKEDARAFLPSNVKCRKLYMTFTYQTFLKFLELRTAPGAQAEIRSFATDFQTNMDKYIDFGSIKKDESITETEIDQVVNVKEEIFQNMINREEFQEPSN